MKPRLVSAVVPTYCDADRAISLVGALRRQALPAGWELEIIVVDDASSDGSVDKLRRELAEAATVIGMQSNAGRSATRNAGAGEAQGERIIFIDCDCLPAAADFIASHLSAWRPSVVATVGVVVGQGEGFWHRYQSLASERRSRLHHAGSTFSGSSQNMMVDHDAFTRCGGFDTRFRHYGFEDRDLLIRIAEFGHVRWVAEAVIRHMDDLSLKLVCRKMQEAGQMSSTLFARLHPCAYESLGYARWDTRRHRWLRCIEGLLEAIIGPIVALGDRMIPHRLVPYWIKAGLVRTLTVASYCVGTSFARRREGARMTT